MKIIVTGCRGQLGTEILKQLREGRSEIGPIPEKLLNATVLPVDLPELDISNYRMVDEFIRRNRPDVIINCAAYTNVDGCEVNHDAAFKANAIGPRNLAQAAENGKQVSVLVELKARFDEEHNIVWAKKLEQAGCHVIYGLVGLKTHSKIALVVRREEDGIRRYVHLGTGNYNDSTAKLYTDMGMFTSKTRYGEDATAVFNLSLIHI